MTNKGWWVSIPVSTLFYRHTTFLTFLLVLQNSLFGCVCQPTINEYDELMMMMMSMKLSGGDDRVEARKLLVP